MKNKNNRFQEWIARVCRIHGTESQLIADTNRMIRDIRAETNRLLREKELQIIRLKQELEKFTSRTYVWVDPSVYHAPFPTAAYDAPSPTTDGKMRAERMDKPQGMRERAMLHQWQENPGILSRLHTDMQRKKMQTVNLDPDTVMLPAATAPEDDWTNGGIDKTIRTQATGRNTGKAEM